MYRSSTLLLVLSFLTGCPEEPIKITPVPAPAPELVSGQFAVKFDSVSSWSCGAQPSKKELQAQEMRLDLAISGEKAHANLDGLRMSGSAEPGFVYLDGIFPDVVMEDNDTQPIGEDEDVDSDDETSADEEDGGDSDGSVDAEAKCEPSEPTDPDQPVNDYGTQISLDLASLNVHKATGILTMNVPGCDAEINVTATWIGDLEGRDHGVTTFSEGGGETGTEETEGGCGDDEDCG